MSSTGTGTGETECTTCAVVPSGCCSMVERNTSWRSITSVRERLTSSRSKSPSTRKAPIMLFAPRKCPNAHSRCC